MLWPISTTKMAYLKKVVRAQTQDICTRYMFIEMDRKPNTKREFNSAKMGENL